MENRPSLEPLQGISVTGFNGSQAPVLGVGEFVLDVHNLQFPITLMVIRGLRFPLLGIDFCTRYGVTFQWEHNKIMCKNPHKVHTSPTPIQVTEMIVPTTVEALCCGLDSDNSPCPPLPDHLVDIYQTSITTLTEEQAQVLHSILHKFKDVFVKTSTELGTLKDVEHVIDTKDHPPIKDPPRRVAPHKLPVIEENVKKLLDMGVIQPSKSPWSASPVLLKKPDGTMRWCVDWRNLNRVTVKDSYPLPRTDDSIDALGGKVWFTALDLQHGYWQVPLREEDWEKTAFATHMGLYEFTRTPMGVANAPATFQRAMEHVLHDLTWSAAIVYLDDVIVPGTTFEEAAENLQLVLGRLQEAGLKIKTKKCEFFRKSVHFLGHAVSRDGMRPQEAKVEKIRTWPVPRNTSQLRTFLGLSGYYRRFIPDFGRISAPLNELLKKGVPWKWTSDRQEAFERLRSALSSDQVLAYPRAEGHYILDTDASAFGAGAVLSQIQDNEERVIGFWSKAWTKAEKQYCVTRKEMLASLLAMEAFAYYLHGLPDFTLRTDHIALRWLQTFKNPTGQVFRWLERLACFNYSVKHRPGKLHLNADALSRRPCPQCGRDSHSTECFEATCTEMAPLNLPTNLRKPDKPKPKRKRKVRKVPDPPPSPPGDPVDWSPESIKEHQEMDPVLKIVLEWVANNSRPDWDEITCKSSQLKYWWARFDSLLLDKNNVLTYIWYLPNGNQKLRAILPGSLLRQYLRELHDTESAGHLGINKTWAKAKKLPFIWISMRATIRAYVKGCSVCQRTKPSHTNRNAYLRQFPAGARLEMIGMDLIGPLPCTPNKNKYILTIVDYWTRWCEAIPIPDKKAETVAMAFMTQFVSRYGVPMTILTDRGTEFVNETFHSCCRELLSTWKVKTTAYHAQTNGLCERLNGCIEKMLRAYIKDTQTNWDVKLPFVLMAYRAAVQETIRETPYRMTFGQEMPIPIDWIYGNPDQVPKSKINFVQDLRISIEAAFERARENVSKAMKRQKRCYDKHVRAHPFKIGDTVMVHDRVRIKGRSPALQAKWIGPYTIVKMLNDITATIQKSPKARRYTVHIDRLKVVKLNDYSGDWITQDQPQEQETGVPPPQGDTDSESVHSDPDSSGDEEDTDPKPPECHQDPPVTVPKVPKPRNMSETPTTPKSTAPPVSTEDKSSNSEDKTPPTRAAQGQNLPSTPPATKGQGPNDTHPRPPDSDSRINPKLKDRTGPTNGDRVTQPLPKPLKQDQTEKQPSDQVRGPSQHSTRTRPQRRIKKVERLNLSASCPDLLVSFQTGADNLSPM